MRKKLLVPLILLFCAGCATTHTGEGNLFDRYSASRKLADATELMKKGETSRAAEVLSGICSGPAVSGVTDEALFRLALLTLKPKADRPASTQAQRLLRQLKKEYPASQWTLLADPISDVASLAEEQRKQSHVLRTSNQSLSREIEELNRRIEQLKHLDQELERKSR